MLGQKTKICNIKGSKIRFKDYKILMCALENFAFKKLYVFNGSDWLSKVVGSST